MILYNLKIFNRGYRRPLKLGLQPKNLIVRRRQRQPEKNNGPKPPARKRRSFVCQTEIPMEISNLVAQPRERLSEAFSPEII